MGFLRYFDDFEKHPRLFLIGEMVRDLLLVLTILLLLKAFRWAVHLIAHIPGPGEEEATKPFFDFHVTNAIITMSDGVSLVLATMIAVMTSLKVIKPVWQQLCR